MNVEIGTEAAPSKEYISGIFVAVSVLGPWHFGTDLGLWALLDIGSRISITERDGAVSLKCSHSKKRKVEFA